MGHQMNLFGSESFLPMTISEVAKTLNVSQASIRNWIKVGHLQFHKDSGISVQSFKSFQKNVVGKEKLTQRANKSFSDNHNHENLVTKIWSSLKKNGDPTLLSEDYQKGLSDAFKNKEGIYYTPESICDIMFSDIPVPSNGETFCDPCCGSGNFVLAALRHGFKPENIFGYDSDPVAVEITRRRILEKTGYSSEKIICIDFLTMATSAVIERLSFDTVLTNPPWGKKLPPDKKRNIGNHLGVGLSLDTSALFFFASLKMLKAGGFLAFLLPESFYKIAIFEDARKELLKYSILSIRDFNKPFKKLLTKAQSICIRKEKNDFRPIVCVKKNETFKHLHETFSNNPASIINFENHPEDVPVILQAFNKPHITLKGRANWGLGIVTGNNKKFCRDYPDDGFIPVYKGTDVQRGCLKEPKTFIPSNFSLYHQVAPIEIFEAQEKILYRFISSRLVFCQDNNQSYCLNSVNMITLADNFPISIGHIVKFFNMDFTNWIFQKIFNSHKILKSDLEIIPIPLEFLENRKTFSDEELLEYYGVKKDCNGTFRIKK